MGVVSSKGQWVVTIKTGTVQIQVSVHQVALDHRVVGRARAEDDSIIITGIRLPLHAGKTGK